MVIEFGTPARNVYAVLVVLTNICRSSRQWLPWYPTFDAMRAGHVRGRCGPVAAAGVVLVPVLRPIGDGDRCRAGKHRRVQTDDADQIAGRVRVVLLACPLVEGGAEARFEEEPVGERRRPAAALDTLGAELALAVGLGRRVRHGRTAERRGARALAAHVLLIPREPDLVAVARLPRDARRVVLPRAVVEGRPRQVRHVGPRGGVPGIHVV